MTDIDTSNDFLVGVQGDLIRIINLPRLAGGMSEAEALRLAAWLVALSSGGREAFEPILNAVENI